MPRAAPRDSRVPISEPDCDSAISRPGFPQGQTTWDGGKLVISTTQQVYVGKGEYLTLTNKEAWSLDGNVLTIEKTETTRQRTTEDAKLIFNRAT